MAVLAALPILAAGYHPHPSQEGGPLPPDYLILAEARIGVLDGDFARLDDVS